MTNYADMADVIYPAIFRTPDNGMETARLRDHQRSGNESQFNHEKALREEFEKAFLHDPQRLIATPGFGDSTGGRRQMTLAEVVEDAFAGKEKGDFYLHSLLSIVGSVAKGDDMQVVAQMWISNLARAHAKFHAESL